MAVDFLVIPAGSNASGAYFNARSDLPITLVIPMSCNPSELRIQCAVSSGASQSGDSFGEVQIQQQPGNIFGTRSPSAPSARFRQPDVRGADWPAADAVLPGLLLSSATITNTIRWQRLAITEVTPEGLCASLASLILDT